MANTQIRTGNEKQTERKHPCGGYISRKERRERGDLFPLLLTLTLEWSQVSLRLENAEAGRKTNIVNNNWGPPASAFSCRAEPATPLLSECCLINSLRSLRPLRAKENIRVVIIYLTQRAQRARSFISLLFALTLEMS